MRLVPLSEATEETRFGGKAAQLGAALGAGLPVPDGWAIEADVVGAIALGDDSARERAAREFASMGASPVAVRSSAVGEDSAIASFAGQHATRLNVIGADAVLHAVTAVWRSGHTEAALAYRRRVGVEGSPRVAVVVQRMVAAEIAGVMFTRNPLDGSDERVIESSWGLGEAVVSGVVEPDRYRLRRGGEVIERTIGDKDVAIHPTADGRTEERPVPERRRRAPTLDDARLAALEALAARCEAVFDGAHDIEWAFDGPRLHLLQRRAVTR